MTRTDRDKHFPSPRYRNFDRQLPRHGTLDIRGLPKKQGAGAHNWGRLEETELEVDVPQLAPNITQPLGSGVNSGGGATIDPAAIPQTQQTEKNEPTRSLGSSATDTDKVSRGRRSSQQTVTGNKIQTVNAEEFKRLSPKLS
ncbi:hypothetical protein IWQ62_005217 [Dispira parvispora]|uniref:Hyaluronan/mRNA-binding protein domain-containing protein n=1 Tax=Dispira parvispora TaxID=1520584 RepID=A0A9W8ARE4_9FUNG|nr:hypothetical protein IWQ62_005217 [Dispira parvispora]